MIQELLFRDTLEEARQGVMGDLDKGSTCPCCEQLAKVYKRKLTSHMVRVLVELYAKNREKPGEYWHSTELDSHDGSGDLGKLKLWGLVEAKPGEGVSGTPHRGLWRITLRGSKFTRGSVLVPRHVHIYNGNRLGFSEEMTTMRLALGDHFDYEELMGQTC